MKLKQNRDRQKKRGNKSEGKGVELQIQQIGDKQQERRHPDRPFHNFRASRSRNPHIFFSLEMSWNGFQSMDVMKGSAGKSEEMKKRQLKT